MTYPKQLFKTPGPFGRGKYAVAGATDADEEAALIAKGWHLTPDAAMGKADKIIAIAENLEAEIDAITPEARKELEALAIELGVKFNARTKDEVLAARIAEAS